MSIQEAYDPVTKWGRAFGVIDYVNYSPPKYEHRGQDIRTVHPSGGYSIAAPIVSLSSGRVSHRYDAKSTGLEIVVDTDRKRGRYEIHCHAADALPVNTKVAAGGRLARNAVLGEKTGTAWSAPHDHFLISDYPDAGHVSSRPVYDPREFIRTALTEGAVADADSKPFNPQPQIGILMDISIVLNAAKPLEQHAIGPGGRVLLTGQTADLLNRWLQWQRAGASDATKAGGMSIAEMDILIGQVLSKVAGAK